MKLFNVCAIKLSLYKNEFIKMVIGQPTFFA